MEFGGWFYTYLEQLNMYLYDSVEPLFSTKEQIIACSFQELSDSKPSTLRKALVIY